MSAADDQAGIPESPELKHGQPATDVSPLTEVARSQLQPDQPLQVAIPQVEAIRADPPAEIAISRVDAIRADPPAEVANFPGEVLRADPPAEVANFPGEVLRADPPLEVVNGPIDVQVPAGGGNFGYVRTFDYPGKIEGIDSLGSPTTIDPPPVRIGASAFPTTGEASGGVPIEVAYDGADVSAALITDGARGGNAMDALSGGGNAVDGGRIDYEGKVSEVATGRAAAIPAGGGNFDYVRTIDYPGKVEGIDSLGSPTTLGNLPPSSSGLEDVLKPEASFVDDLHGTSIDGVVEPSDADVTPGSDSAFRPLDQVGGVLDPDDRSAHIGLGADEAALITDGARDDETANDPDAVPSGAGNRDNAGTFEGIAALGSPTTVDPPKARVRWSKPVWGMVAAMVLIVPLAFVGGTLAGLGAEPGATTPAGALPPKKSDPPGASGAIASAIVPNDGIGATADPDGGPGSTAAPGGEPTAGSGPGTVPTPKPTLKPSPKPTPVPTKPGSGGEATPAPGGKLKITPTEVDGSCNKGLATFDVILDNSANGTDASWTLQFGAGVGGGAWGTASQASGTVPAGQLFIVAIEPIDVCKSLASPTTFQLTISSGGTQTAVAYTVTP